MANIQILDRVEALERLIQENQLLFFDSLARHPERQQEAVQHLLRAHREILEETAVEQFSDVPENARRQALDQYMQNLQRQLTSCLIGFTGNQLALSPHLQIEDYRSTLLFGVASFIGSEYDIMLFSNWNTGLQDYSKNLSNIHQLGDGGNGSEEVDIRRACDLYHLKEKTIIVKISTRDQKAKVQVRRLIIGGNREKTMTIQGRLISYLYLMPSQPMVLYSVSDELFEHNKQLANNLSFMFAPVILRS